MPTLFWMSGRFYDLGFIIICLYDDVIIYECFQRKIGPVRLYYITCYFYVCYHAYFRLGWVKEGIGVPRRVRAGARNRRKHV